MSSTNTWILYQVAELARRYGLRPSEAEAEYYFSEDPHGEHARFGIRFPHGSSDIEKSERLRQLKSALGVPEGKEELVKSEEYEIEDAIERALTLAPRSRVR